MGKQGKQVCAESEQTWHPASEVCAISLSFECAHTCVHIRSTVKLCQPQADTRTPTLKMLKVGGP